MVRRTPKRNVVSSSLAGGAKMTAVSRFLWFTAVFVVVSFGRLRCAAEMVLTFSAAWCRQELCAN